MKNDKEKLIKLMQDNPDLPVVFMVSNEEMCYEYSYTVMQEFSPDITELYCYEGYDGTIFSDDVDEVKEHFYDELCECEECINMSDEEFEKYVEKYVEEKVEHKKVIRIYVNP